MSKCLTMVAFALLVMTGSMALRNIAVASAVNSGSLAPAVWAHGGAPPPPIPPGGGN